MRFLLSLWRLFVLITIVALMSYLVLSTTKIYTQTTKEQKAQQQDITNLLLSQASILSAPLLMENNLIPLYELAKNIAKEPFVADVRFYDNTGVKLVDSATSPEEQTINEAGNNPTSEPIKNEQTTITYQPLNSEKEQITSPLMTRKVYDIPLIRPIWYNGENLGFVQIDYIAKQTSFWTKRHYLNNVYHVYIALGLSFLCGGMFYHVFLRRFLAKSSPLLKVKKWLD